MSQSSVGGQLWPTGQRWPVSSFVNQVLLEHNRTVHPCIIVYGGVQGSEVEAEIQGPTS